MHQNFKIYDHWRGIWPKGATRGPTLGLADPTGRPTQGQQLLGPTFSNSFVTVVTSLSLHACCRWSLNRGREGGVKLSCSLSHSHSLSQILARVFIEFWLKIDFKISLFLISLLREQPHTWRNNSRVRISFSFANVTWTELFLVSSSSFLLQAWHYYIFNFQRREFFIFRGVLWKCLRAIVTVNTTFSKAFLCMPLLIK